MATGVIDVQEVYDIRGRVQLTPMAIGTTAAEYNGFTGTDIPQIGIYTVWSTVACHIKHNKAVSETACTEDNGLLVNPKVPFDMRIYKNDVISAISDTTAGKLKFMLTKVEAQ